jgi:hypothetical protein
VQELLRPQGRGTTQIYTHVLNKGGLGVLSPIDAVTEPLDHVTEPMAFLARHQRRIIVACIAATSRCSSPVKANTSARTAVERLARLEHLRARDEALAGGGAEQVELEFHAQHLRARQAWKTARRSRRRCRRRWR